MTLKHIYFSSKVHLLLKITMLILTFTSFISFFFVIYHSMKSYDLDLSYKGITFFISLFSPFKDLFSITFVAIGSYLVAQQNLLTNKQNRREQYLEWRKEKEKLIKKNPAINDFQIYGKAEAKLPEVYDFLLEYDILDKPIAESQLLDLLIIHIIFLV